MKIQQVLGVCFAAFASLSAGAVLRAEPLEKRATSTSTSASASTTSAVADGSCKNTALTRGCWSNGYSIDTDFDQKFPSTGNTVTYSLEITNTTCNPDGHGSRLCLLFNGQYPGPTIHATWGDNVVVNVKNSMQDNGTSVHWHGVRQYHTPGQDGVNGVSECPLAPGDTKTYSFQATQFGTSWYHSHYSAQYGDGVSGAIIFDGPASANYDIDIGPYPITDWYYQTAAQVNSLALQNLPGLPPSANNVLINGTNKNAKGGGSYNQVTLQSGKKYRLRLINTSADNYFRVSIDNHTMLVMTTDFVPIKPFAASTLLIGIGQRFDVVINANQTAGNYWFRANPASDCDSQNDFYGRAVWSYSTVTVGTPTSPAWSESSTCLQSQLADPYWYQPFPSGTFSMAAKDLDLTETDAQVIPGGDTVTVWALGNSTMNVDYEKPTLQYVMDGNTSYAAEMVIIPTTSEGNWNYWLIQQASDAPAVPHPIHLHGHDFYILGSGSGMYSSSVSLNYATAIRRDTASVPASGWLAISFSSNNPGAWLMHCHIAWHASGGLAVQFLEAPSQITLPSTSAFEATCKNWNKYYETAYWRKDDSGI
ncbi:hypothetical protein LTR85_002486 [Meristemomyces frigidus]|nr:hypothetical protein LTR85_002486 [Meristemomyces frigidus]